MRLFVYGMGRCGTTAIARAFSHAMNYVSSHEARNGCSDKVTGWPENCIAVDPHFLWVRQQLRETYPDAMLLHVARDRSAVVESWLRRDSEAARFNLRGGVVLASLMFQLRPPDVTARDLERLYDAMLEIGGKPVTRIEDHRGWFPQLWRVLKCEGDLGAAQQELLAGHNSSETP